MVDQNYDRILDKISRVSGLDKDEIERRVEAKRAKLSGLISREGAAQIIASELGLNFENEQLKIEELLPGMRKANVIGKIINLFPIRTFTTKKGDEGKVANLVIADETSNIKVVLWDTNHIALLENNSISIGSVVEIANATMRDNELHLGSFSEIKPSSEELGIVNTKRIIKEKSISDFRNSDSVQTRAFIVQTFEPRFFHVCMECRKKVVSGSDGFICEQHGKVPAEKRALINMVIDDGTETIRTVVFHDSLQELGLEVSADPEEIARQRQSLLGKEMVFSGSVKLNKFFNNMEFVADKIKEIDMDELLAKLESA
ncbi:DUF2240 family protein [Candidatus Pacearchaeota archaeon]|nr:DUF2240 family protein [Candidatus Pacearchaeota archaeon]